MKEKALPLQGWHHTKSMPVRDRLHCALARGVDSSRVMMANVVFIYWLMMNLPLCLPTVIW